MEGTPKDIKALEFFFVRCKTELSLFFNKRGENEMLKKMEPSKRRRENSTKKSTYIKNNKYNKYK